MSAAGMSSNISHAKTHNRNLASRVVILGTPKERYQTKQFHQFGHKLETPNDWFSVLNAVLGCHFRAPLAFVRI